MKLSQSLFCMFPLILIFVFASFWGHFLLFGALIGCFGVGVGFNNCSWVYPCSRTTLIFYVSVNSDICFYLLLGSFLTFWGPGGLFLGSG